MTSSYKRWCTQPHHVAAVLPSALQAIFAVRRSAGSAVLKSRVDNNLVFQYGTAGTEPHSRHATVIVVAGSFDGKNTTSSYSCVPCTSCHGSTGVPSHTDHAR